MQSEQLFRPGGRIEQMGKMVERPLFRSDRRNGTKASFEAPLMFGLGVTIHRLFIRSLRGNQAELSLLVTWATALGVEGTLSLIYSTTFRSTITSYSGRSWTIGGYHISEVRAFGFVISVAILGGLYLLLARSRFGRSVRATASAAPPILITIFKAALRLS